MTTSGCSAYYTTRFRLSAVCQISTSYWEENYCSIEACTAANEVYVVQLDSSLNVTFVLPQDSELQSITRDGVNVKAMFAVTDNVYSYITSSVGTGHAGLYVMVHETYEETINCSSTVFVIEQASGVSAKLSETVTAQVHYGTASATVADFTARFNNIEHQISVAVYQQDFIYLPTISSITIGNAGLLTVTTHKSFALAPDALQIAHDSEIIQFSLSFDLTVSDVCSDTATQCNGVIECDNLSDEIGCSTSGAYSRMAIQAGTEITVFAPPTDHSICFYAFGGGLYVVPNITSSNSQEMGSAIVTSTAGYHCFTFTVQTSGGRITQYQFDINSNEISSETETSDNSAISCWVFQQQSGANFKNILVYDKVLTTAEMTNYISMCGDSSYPADADLYLDFHAIVTINLAVTDYVDYSGASLFGYVVLTDMCAESAAPSGGVDLVSTYICSTGAAITHHCCHSNTEQCTGTVVARCDDSDESECDYFESGIVATDSTCSSRATIVNEYNNNLAGAALKANNAFKDCTAEDCIAEVYLEDLMRNETTTWANEDSMTYNNWDTAPVAADSDRPVVLQESGSWSLADSLPEEATLLCEMEATDKSLLFTNDSDYSRLQISKTTTFNKMTLCFASYGSGVLLHYVGSSSITKKDIYIYIDQRSSTLYVTVYIAGFPEYFEVEDDGTANKYMCIRWEKTTGRIDLAARGEWLVGQNTYASSRKVNLPKTGKLVVGAALDTTTGTSIVTSNKFTGRVFNLAIWDSFLNPLVLKETSENGVCNARVKTDGWLTFEEVIAGVTDSDMYNYGDDYDDPYCNMRKKRVSGEEPALSAATTTATSGVFTFTVDYDRYISSPADSSLWALTTESGVEVELESESYTIREQDDVGNIKLDALSWLCFVGLDEEKKHSFNVTIHSTGLTTLQIGDTVKTVAAGSPITESFPNVYAVESTKICVTNVLSPSDYAPLDGYIERITYSYSTTSILCPGEAASIDNIGLLSWPATDSAGTVTTTCEYGSNASYSVVGIATRECTTANGWATTIDSSDCAVKFTISSADATEYFVNTTVTTENVEEYTEAISQVIQEAADISDEQLTTAADAMEKISVTENVTITTTTMESIVEVANTINVNTDRETMQESDSATKVVNAVASLVAKVELEEGATFESKTPSVSVAAFNPGITDTAEDQDVAEQLTEITATFVEGDDGTDININAGDTSTDRITIGIDKVKTGQNVWFTRYRKDSSLFTSDTEFELDGGVIGAGIGEYSQQFEDNDGVTMTFVTSAENKNAYCQYWDLNATEPGWSSEGMTLVEKTDTYIVCETSHLTNFAILINPSNTIFTGTQLLVLDVITYIGCSLSIIGLLATVIGLAFFKQIRSVSTNRVHIGLALSLLVSYIVLLVGGELTQNEGVCYFFAMAIHFCFLSAFCWMLCEGVNLYLRLVVVFASSSRMFLKFSLFSTIVPAVIVLITAIVEFAGGNGAYIVYNPASGNAIYCFLDYEARIAAFMLPLILILCANFLVFLLVMKVLFANKKSATATDRTLWFARLRSAIAVSTLVGLTWVIGFLAIGEASFGINVIFTLFNSLQGCLICYLYCIAKNDVVTKWKTSLKSSFSRTSRTDKSGISSSSMAQPPSKGNTKSTSVGMSIVSKASAPPPQSRNNVYSNEASKMIAPPEDEDPVYEDYSNSAEEDEHVYEDFATATKQAEGGGTLRGTEKRGILPAGEKKRVDLTLSRNLQSQVREKVETYESIAAGGAKVNLTCPVDVEPSCPTPSFQIKSDSGVSEDSRSPFNL